MCARSIHFRFLFSILQNCGYSEISVKRRTNRLVPCHFVLWPRSTSTGSRLRSFRSFTRLGLVRCSLPTPAWSTRALATHRSRLFVSKNSNSETQSQNRCPVSPGSPDKFWAGRWRRHRVVVVPGIGRFSRSTIKNNKPTVQKPFAYHIVVVEKGSPFFSVIQPDSSPIASVTRRY